MIAFLPPFAANTSAGLRQPASAFGALAFVVTPRGGGIQTYRVDETGVRRLATRTALDPGAVFGSMAVDSRRKRLYVLTDRAGKATAVYALRYRPDGRVELLAKSLVKIEASNLVVDGTGTRLALVIAGKIKPYRILDSGRIAPSGKTLEGSWGRTYMVAKATSGRVFTLVNEAFIDTQSSEIRAYDWRGGRLEAVAGFRPFIGYNESFGRIAPDVDGKRLWASSYRYVRQIDVRPTRKEGRVVAKVPLGVPVFDPVGRGVYVLGGEQALWVPEAGGTPKAVGRAGAGVYYTAEVRLDAKRRRLIVADGARGVRFGLYSIGPDHSLKPIQEYETHADFVSLIAVAED